MSHLDKEIAKRVLMMCAGNLAVCGSDEFSASQHQKVAIARGLAQDPEVFLLDEPTSNLDVKHQVNVMKLLKKLSAERSMVTVMVSHNLNISARFADRMILMSSPGVIRQIGSPAEVLTWENMAEVYGVRCDIASVDGRPHVIIMDSLEEGSRFGC